MGLEERLEDHEGEVRRDQVGHGEQLIAPREYLHVGWQSDDVDRTLAEVLVDHVRDPAEVLVEDRPIVDDRDVGSSTFDIASVP